MCITCSRTHARTHARTHTHIYLIILLPSKYNALLTHVRQLYQDGHGPNSKYSLLGSRCPALSVWPDMPSCGQTGGCWCCNRVFLGEIRIFVWPLLPSLKFHIGSPHPVSRFPLKYRNNYYFDLDNIYDYYDYHHQSSGHEWCVLTIILEISWRYTCDPTIIAAK